MAQIYVDGRAYEVDPKQNLLRACLGVGLSIPYFCWHPALGSLGACRQCAVKQYKGEEDTKGRIVMACMTPAAPGTRISISDPEVVAFRAAIIEGLMANHPHDCPVCDEGGECHLQDMTVLTGHHRRRYSYEKRTFRNQYLGPFVHHEMNRCIQCYRCVRFYCDYAGGRDLAAMGIHSTVYFGRDRDGKLESSFSGNLVEVCPTGVFTDATLKQHYTRKWDLEYAPSICVHCGLGCNTSPGARYGKLRRVANRANPAVNGSFLCDRGRFGYEYVDAPSRVRRSLVRASGSLRTATRDEALDRLSGLLRQSRGLLGIGSPRASLEVNYALRKLVGAESFFPGVSAGELDLLSGMVRLLEEGPYRSCSMGEAEQCDAVLVLGEDVEGIAPVMALSLRQSVRQASFAAAGRLGIPSWLDQSVRQAAGDVRSPLYVASPYATSLDELALRTFRGAPQDIVRLGLDIVQQLGLGPSEAGSKRNEPLSEQIARTLGQAARPLIVAGPSSGNLALPRAAAMIAAALHREGRAARLSLLAPECNSYGIAMLGGRGLEQAVESVESGAVDTVVIVENDLYQRLPAARVEALLDKAQHVIVCDHFDSRTAARAELVLAASTFAEASGTLVNNEGRAQRFFSALAPDEEISPSWRWLAEASRLSARGSATFNALDDVIDRLCAEEPRLASVRNAAPPASFRLHGTRVPREPHRYSGRTAMLAHLTMQEPKPPIDSDGPLAYSMEGYPSRPPPSIAPFSWAPGWNSGRAPPNLATATGPSFDDPPNGVRLFEPRPATSQEPRAAGGSESSASVRVFEPGPSSGQQLGASALEVPAPFVPRTGQCFAVPIYHLFGSEPLSARAHAIAGLVPLPYVALRPDAAASLGIAENGLAVVRIGEATARLPVRIRPDLPEGVAGLPVGLCFEGISLPVWIEVTAS